MEPMPFIVTVRRIQPIGEPPYNWKPYLAYVNHIGTGPWWRFWRRHEHVRTLGPLQMFDSIEHVMETARRQALEVLHPDIADTINLQERPNVPPPPPPREHEFQLRLVPGGVTSTCKCGKWNGEHVSANISTPDAELQVEFDRHLNEVEAAARAGTGIPETKGVV